MSSILDDLSAAPDATTRAEPVAPGRATAKPHSASPALAAVLRRHRSAVAEVFADAMDISPRWKAAAEARREQRPAHVELEFGAFADYLIEFYATGDDTFRTLLVGEKIKALYDPELGDEARRAQAAELGRIESEQLGELVAGKVGAADQQRLCSDLADIAATLSRRQKKELRILLVGDCLFLDIVPFTVGALLDEGISIVTGYAVSKHPAQLLAELRTRTAKSFDMVFYSPYTYKFSTSYSALSRWRGAAASAAAIERVVDETWVDSKAVLELLAREFDAPVYVHNASNVIRDGSRIKRVTKLRLTSRARRLASARVERLLGDEVAAQNAATFKHLFVLDEHALVRAAGEDKAGAFFHCRPLQHPAVLGSLLAPHYVDILFVNAYLVQKKVVVCDLDNTLWDGVIGEGAVKHHHDRQALLKGLKERGVVLAINSKNDPKNVHWRGGTLGDDDFVFSAVSWEPKAHGMTRIQNGLNLKSKDFVFIDDREDERALMRAAHPDVVCLDATAPATWERIRLWHARLDDVADMDRTLMYRQRDQREAFVRDDVMSHSEKSALFAALELSLVIAGARRQDLKRVSELINRTSQFNLENSRVTYPEVCGWHASPSTHVIVTGKTADRFGTMGTTCVAAARIDGDTMTLLPFVLSCRVFGYGIETVVMNHLKSVAIGRGAKRIVGRYLPTAQNGPCKDFLADNGFAAVDGGWEFDLPGASKADPEWLRVTIDA